MFRILLVIAALPVPSSLVGQRLASLPAHRSALHYDRSLADSAMALPRTYWLEGGVVGAVTVGVLGTVWFRGASDSRPSLGSTVVIGALCGAAGFAPGALIGGQFRKPTR
jgi:hypothetical protein